MSRKIFLFLALTSTLLFFPVPAVSQDEQGESMSQDSLETKIQQYTQKIIELGQAKKTLKNEINYLNSQIDLTLLQITQTEAAIEKLKQEIAQLTVKIDQLDVNLNQLSAVFIQQINQNYKLKKKLPPFFTLVFGGFNQFLQQQKYLACVQENSRQTLLSMETIRTNYDLQKQKKQQKQQQLEDLQTKLDSQKNQLKDQKEAKDHLLTITQNDEAKYQKLKAEAEAELTALLNAKFTGKRQVKQGEALGMMGNTGYSFGEHLHFGLYQLTESQLSSWSYTNDLDPTEFLNQNRWPLNQPITITQGRGHTKYSYLYSDRFHHGIDMVSPNKTIVAVQEGVAYFFRNPKSSLGNHVKLFHPDGHMTLYLHLQ